MSTAEKIKKTVLIALGFGLSTYMMMSGFAMLDEEEKKSADIGVVKVEKN